MRGTPLLQAIIVSAVFLLTGLPVWRFTRPATVAAAPATTGGIPAASIPDAGLERLAVTAEFAPAPADFRITSLEDVVIEGQGPAARFTKDATMRVPPEGLDLVIRAHWLPPAAGNTPAAIRVAIHFADGRAVEKSFWAAADGSLTEVFTVPGSASSAVP